jgi:uncharacterized membrane protein YedE/YeeE
MFDYIYEPWPWYVSGPLIGLMVPLLLLFGNKQFGISSSLRHMCAAVLPTKVEFFQYNWKEHRWNLFFVAGVVIGGMIAGFFFSEEEIIISAATVADLKAIGIEDVDGMLPRSIFSWENLMTFKGLVFIILGGFLVGFGTRYANGCTSGHAIMGLSNLSWVSLVAVVGFFVGGLLVTHFLLPVLI